MTRSARASGAGTSLSTAAGGQQPQQGQHKRGKRGAPQTFAWKLFSILEAGTPIVGWSTEGDSFTVHNDKDFERDVLTANYRHGKFSSFQRQLNMYGFRKVADCSDRTYSHPFFRRDCPDLLTKVRRVNPTHGRNASANANNSSPSSSGTATSAGAAAISQEPPALAKDVDSRRVKKSGVERKVNDDDGFGAETTGESEQGDDDLTPAAARKKRRLGEASGSNGVEFKSVDLANTKPGVEINSNAQRPAHFWAGGIDAGRQPAGVGSAARAAGAGGARPDVKSAPRSSPAVRKQAKSAAVASADKQAKAHSKAQARAQAKQLKKATAAAAAAGANNGNGNKNALVTAQRARGVPIQFSQMTDATQKYRPQHQKQQFLSGLCGSSWAKACPSPSTSSAASSMESSPAVLSFRIGGVAPPSGMDNSGAAARGMPSMPMVMRGGAHGNPAAGSDFASSNVTAQSATAVPPSPGSTSLPAPRGTGVLDLNWRRDYDGDQNNGEVFNSSAHAANSGTALTAPGLYYGAWSNGGDSSAGGNGTGPSNGGVGKPEEQPPLWLDKAFGFGAALARCPSTDLIFDANAALIADGSMENNGGSAAAGSGWASPSDHSDLAATSVGRGVNCNSAELVTPTSLDGGRIGSAGGGDEIDVSTIGASAWSLENIGSGVGAAGWGGGWEELPLLGGGGSGATAGGLRGARSSITLGGGKRPGAGLQQHQKRGHMRTFSTMSVLSMPGVDAPAPFDWAMLDPDSALLRELDDVDADGEFAAVTGAVMGLDANHNGSNVLQQHNHHHHHHRTSSTLSALSAASAPPFPLMAYSSELSSSSESAASSAPSGSNTTKNDAFCGGSAIATSAPGEGRGGDAWGVGMSNPGAVAASRPTAALFT